MDVGMWMGIRRRREWVGLFKRRNNGSKAVKGRDNMPRREGHRESEDGNPNSKVEVDIQR
jgi:hypothetical protein